MLAHSRIDRYDIKEVLGQGGMGIVFKAYDSNRKGFVALKTMKDAADPAALELFNQEWRTLANLSHPNIVDVLNSGDFEDEGERRPYFVMPLLPGKTLDKLIKDSGHRLTVERVVEILVQTCRGLQAAHSSGLVHRDLKPSNLFILSDDSVKIIDFGMVHLADAAKSATGIKGTLQYMAPEQLEMKEVTSATDIFSLGVVGYEAMTGRRPFERATDRAVVDAIRREFPPPASALNPAVSRVLAQVVAKAMAKNPWNRFTSAREFSDCLQRALKGEPIEGFEVSRLQPRLERARRALTEGDFEYAHEILNELQLEGHVDPEITVLLEQEKEAARSKAIRQLLDSARTRLQEDELPLAWQKIQEALQRDPGNTEGLALQAEIETRRSDQQVEKWRLLVHQHLHNHSFTQARHAIEEIRKIRPDDPAIRELVQTADQRQKDYEKACEEKERAFQSAMRCYKGGEISTALSKLEKILEVDSREPGLSLPGRDELYRETYNKIRSEWEAVEHTTAEIERVIANGDLPRAAELSNEQSARYPNDLGLQALKLKVEDLLRQEKSSYIAEIGRRAEAEPDLNRRVQYLEEALARYPKEPHFEELAAILRKRRDLVNSIVAKARQYEEQNLQTEALGQWTTLRNIHPQYPGLDFELERVERQRDQQKRQDAKLDWVNEIDHLLQASDFKRAYERSAEALEIFPGDQELLTFRRLAQEGRDRGLEAVALMEQAQALTGERRTDEAMKLLRKAGTLDPNNSKIRTRIADLLAADAQAMLVRDWRAADKLVQEALQVAPDHPLARSLRSSVLLAKRTEFIDHCVSQARELQATGDINGALAEVQEGLGSYPNDGRLIQLQNTLREQARARRNRDLQELKQLSEGARQTRDETTLTALFDRGRLLSKLYPDDHEISAITEQIEENVRNTELEETKLFPLTTGAAPAPRRDVGSTATVAMPEAAPVRKSWSQRLRLFAPRSVWQPVRHAVGSGAGSVQSAYSNAQARLQQFPVAQRLGLMIGVPLLIAVLVFAAVVLRPKPQPAPSVAKQLTTVTLDNIDGATIMIDGKAVQDQAPRLEPGTHNITATKLGFKPDPKTVTADGQPKSVSFKWEPEPQAIRISTDIKMGKVWLDNAEIGALQDGNFTYDLPGAGEHTLKLMDGKNEVFSVQFETTPGAPAHLVRAPVSRGVPIAVVSRLGSRAVIQSNMAGVKVALKNGETQVVQPQGTEMTLQAADSEIMIDTGNSPVSLALETSNAPVLSIRAGVVNKGTLAIEANVGEADVYIDSKKNSRRLKNGKWFGQFEPGEHRVAVVLDGYDASPEQRVTIAAGKRVPVQFALTPVVTTAYLKIEGGTPDAEVFLDGRRIDKLNSSGSLGPIEVQPNVEHTIRLQKEDHEAMAELRRKAPAKDTITLSGADVRLKPFGTLTLAVQPPDAIVTIRRRGDSAARRVSGNTLRLPEGTYTVQASSDPEHYMPVEKDVRVTAGQPVQLPVMVPRKVEAIPITPTKRDVPDLFIAADWTKEDGGIWRANGTVYLKATHFHYVFDAWRIKKTLGQEKILWRTYTKDDNYIQFEVDGTNYTRREFVKGKGGPEHKQPHGLGKPESYRLDIEVAADLIRVNVGEAHDSIATTVESRTGFSGKFALRFVR